MVIWSKVYICCKYVFTVFLINIGNILIDFLDANTKKEAYTTIIYANKLLKRSLWKYRLTKQDILSTNGAIYK